MRSPSLFVIGKSDMANLGGFPTVTRHGPFKPSGLCNPESFLRQRLPFTFRFRRVRWGLVSRGLVGIGGLCGPHNSIYSLVKFLASTP
ncbi:hypothetical protein AVEN_13004-1 [Araneus ventricosus]|uniref:Uncharacterized protein n=1 Tax=Araneus ventricosus TaxID=182803 RepID=A0A4Y2HM42_ARAVE|nr:hypothetical protein AVEN_13004-1 [Araneus ventricosus]